MQFQLYLCLCVLKYRGNHKNVDLSEKWGFCVCVCVSKIK